MDASLMVQVGQKFVVVKDADGSERRVDKDCIAFRDTFKLKQSWEHISPVLLPPVGVASGPVTVDGREAVLSSQVEVGSLFGLCRRNRPRHCALRASLRQISVPLAHFDASGSVQCRGCVLAMMARVVGSRICLVPGWVLSRFSPSMFVCDDGAYGWEPAGLLLVAVGCWLRLICRAFNHVLATLLTAGLHPRLLRWKGVHKRVDGQH